MSEPAILDWDRVIHKNVRTSDKLQREALLLKLATRSQ